MIFTFTREQMQDLYPCEVHFKSAIENNTIRNCSRQLVQHVAKIYEEATGKHVNVGSCSTCIFRFIKEVAVLYLKDLENYTKESEKQEQKELKDAVQSPEKEEEGTKEEPVPVGPNKPRRGRPRKN